jgi:hypothetical protein
MKLAEIKIGQIVGVKNSPANRDKKLLPRRAEVLRPSSFLRKPPKEPTA